MKVAPSKRRGFPGDFEVINLKNQELVKMLDTKEIMKKRLVYKDLMLVITRFEEKHKKYLGF